MTVGIKTMKLYHQVGRVFNELNALGISPDDPLEVETLCAFDQYHYLGTEAVEEAINKLKIDASMDVLEVGGGIGGPSRYLAKTAGSYVTALELQSDLNETADHLTERCGLSNRVNHVCGDFLKNPLGVTTYDALVSWLTFLHIPDRKRLYHQCFKALKPGAGIYVEDYFERSPLTIAQRAALSEQVYCDYVPTMAQYNQDLAHAGFEHVELIDVSPSWTEFVTARLEAFKATHERNLALHGTEVTEGLMEFYSTIVELFQSGNLGGICFVAYKPKEPLQKS